RSPSRARSTSPRTSLSGPLRTARMLSRTRGPDHDRSHRRAEDALSAHMREARTRAVRAAVALLIGTVIGYLTSDLVMDVLRAPITEIAESRSASLNYDSVTGAFDLQVRIALYSGIILSSPVWLGEIFGF